MMGSPIIIRCLHILVQTLTPQHKGPCIPRVHHGHMCKSNLVYAAYAYRCTYPLNQKEGELHRACFDRCKLATNMMACFLLLRSSLSLDALSLCTRLLPALLNSHLSPRTFAILSLPLLLLINLERNGGTYSQERHAHRPSACPVVRVTSCCCVASRWTKL